MTAMNERCLEYEQLADVMRTILERVLRHTSSASPMSGEGSAEYAYRMGLASANMYEYLEEANSKFHQIDNAYRERVE